MQDKFLQAIRDAIQEIAETMLFVEIIPGESEHARCSLGADVSAVIGYSSSLKGSMRLAGPQKTVLKLAAALLGEERDVLDKEMEDAFSELANMIAGGVQTRVEGELGMIRMSPPVVISGKNHQVSSDRSFICVSHQFDLDGDPFFTELYYSQEKAEEKGSEDKNRRYGFSLTLPLPGFPGDGNEDLSAFAPQSEDEEVPKSIPLDTEAFVTAVKAAFAKQMEGWSKEVTQEMVRHMLPALAEKLVRQEIERIKREGL
ncbi:MAG: hypothetical protein G8345_06730 [Magnetococcales bacterium]|nr:hypothetical protein [Magnetococcales bacterium]